MNIQDFQAAIYTSIPLVKQMKLNLLRIDPLQMMASAPIAPNINDKSTVFGGSGAALMTICGWSLIKYNLESLKVFNDVVIHQSKLHWNQAQTDDLIITAVIDQALEWEKIVLNLKNKNRATKVKVTCQVLNQNQQLCSQMQGSYVILKQ